jgi:hypothetical protein
MVEEKITKGYKLRTVLETSELIAKLTTLGDVYGFGKKGIKFIPHTPDWPQVFFRQNGDVDVLAGDMSKQDVNEYIKLLAEATGLEIEIVEEV